MGDAAQQAEGEDAKGVNVSQQEVDAVLAEFGGDARAAITALLHDLHMLAHDAEASTSHGYVRGRVIKLKVRPHGLPQG
jgi:hypothetical protein